MLRESVLSKQQVLSGFPKTKIGRLAFEDFMDGTPGRYVSVTGKGKEQLEGKEKREREKERKKVVEVDYDVNNCELTEDGEGAHHGGKAQAYKPKGNQFCFEN